MLELIATSPSLYVAAIEGIVSRSVPPDIAAKVLKCELPLSEKQINDLESLFEEQDSVWRRASVELLRPSLLSAEQLGTYGAKLIADEHEEIRLAAKKLLAKP